MKLYRRFSSQLTSLKRSRAKKLISAAGATLTVVISLWLVSGAHHTRLLMTASLLPEIGIDSSREPEVEAATRGLSRQRKDFEKALNILATAAVADQQLSQYLERVQNRVKGEAAPPESGSGVRVVKSTKRRAAANAHEQNQPKGPWAKIKGFFGSKMVADNKAATGETGEARVQTLSAGNEPAVVTPISASQDSSVAVGESLVVGDVKFETNPAIERWISYYTASERGRRTMQTGIDRSGAYLDMSRAEFRRLGVPEDLVWLAHVESVWHSTAVSSAAAGGLWQFIPRTATDYGLTVSDDVDERMFPEKQTRVAATYLRDLHTIFGDWALAMAAYNCGEPRVMEAIVKNGRANFWDLHGKQLLPKETLNYVPKILAAIAVARRAESYGFTRAPEMEASFSGR